MKTSSIGALWNTVMPIVLAFSTSWINSSFQTGSNVFCLMLDRSVEHKADEKDKIYSDSLRWFDVIASVSV